jgi:sugar transferase EpsL
VKRLMDVFGAGVGLLLLSPVIAVTAVVVRAALGRPVLFRQERPGLHGRPFTMFKFRTMLDARDAAGTPLADDRRLTRVGRILRGTSLDELPALWNVLRGDMSLVGPRPLLMEYLPLYSPLQARRHEVRPGITGWAQIHGRNAVGWEERFVLDTWYVDNRSLLLDLRILLMTVGSVLARHGISQEGHATMPRFTGGAGGSATGSSG